MEIGAPEIRERGSKTRYEVSINGELLWFSVEKEYGALLADRADAALLAVLIPAMRDGLAIRVIGSISEKVLYNAAGPLQSALCTIDPTLHRIPVTVERTVRPTAAGGVSTGFSGGVDSFSVIRRHYLRSPVPGFRLTHLTIHDVYMPDNFVEFDFATMAKGYRSVKHLAEKWGLPLVAVSSNVGQFYRGQRFEDSHTIRNAAAAHVLSNGIGRYFYASGYPISMHAVKKHSDIAIADAALLPMLSSEAVECFSGDPEYSRLEKTILISDVTETYEHLHVCAVHWGSNCSKCFKCMRTMYTLEKIGKLHLYKDAFNFDVYRRNKEQWLENMRAANDIFVAEVDRYENG